MRAPTYYQQCQDQKRYIQQLENAKSQSDSLIEELKEKLKAEKAKNKKLRESKQPVESLQNSNKKLNELIEESKKKRAEKLKLNTIEQAQTLESDSKGNTNRKEGSSRFVAKEMNENADDGSLDAMSTLKKEEALASKFSPFQEGQDKTEDRGKVQDFQEEDHPPKIEGCDDKEDSECQNLFENFDSNENHHSNKSDNNQTSKVEQEKQNWYEEEKIPDGNDTENLFEEDYLKESDCLEESGMSKS